MNQEQVYLKQILFELRQLVDTGISITSEVEIKNDSGNALPTDITKLGGVAINLGAGAVGTGTQRITLASDDPAVTALQLIDNAVSGTGFNISQINGVTPLMGNGVTGTGSHRVTIASDNTPFAVKTDQTTPGTTDHVSPIAGQNGVQGGSGTVSATTQRVVLATDVALPAGTNAIGKLAANSGVDIGDVDVTSVTCAATNAKVDVGLVNGEAVDVGAGTEAAAIRVTLPTDGTGKLATVSTVTTVSTLTSGNVGGFTTLVSSTITMSVAGAYATGDYMGTTTTPQSFANVVRTSGGTGVIKSITIQDNITNANVAMELWLLSATFTAPTDNAAWAISDAESLTVQAVIPIATTGWYATSNNQVYHDNTISIPIKPAATSLFYALVARGTTPSFASSDLTITLGILQD